MFGCTHNTPRRTHGKIVGNQHTYLSTDRKGGGADLWRSIIALVVAVSVWTGLAFGEGSAEAGASGEPSPMHVGIVLDSSGSMAQNDPDELSLLGAMIFTDLVAPGDRLGIFTMVPGDETLLPMKPVQGRKSAIKQKIRSVPFETQTDCAGPLRRAAGELRSARSTESNASQFIVFLSDGVCPGVGEPGGWRNSPLAGALEDLRSAGVRVYTIGLMGGTSMGKKRAAERILQAMAEETRGAYYPTKSAGQLPERFAEILGQIRGSRAQSFEVSASGSGRFTLDGYVRDASVIVTGSGERLAVRKLVSGDGSDLDVPDPGGARFSAREGDLYVAAGRSGSEARYAAARIESPVAGNWNMTVAGSEGTEGIVIQNYALDPVVASLPSSPTFVDSEFTVVGILHDREGDRLEDEEFLERIHFELEMTGPDGETVTKSMEATDDGRFVRSVSVSESGEYDIRVRAAMKEGPLDKVSAAKSLRISAVDLQVQTPKSIDLGRLKAGRKSKPVAVDLSESEIVGRHDLTVDLEGMDRVDAEAEESDIGPETEKVSVRFQPRRSHPGGERNGDLVVRSGESTSTVPVRVRVVPLTFWERYGETILTILVGIGLLVLLVFVVYGFISPYPFPAHLRFNWGDDMERLDKNEMIISEVQGTDAGFYQNAAFVIGGRGSSLSVGGTRLCVLEATGKNQVTIRAGDGVQLCRVNKFNPDKESEVDGGEAIMTPGDVYRAGDLYIRIR